MIDIDMEEYEKGVQDLIYNVVGKIYLHKGEEPPTTLDHKNKLSTI